MVIMPGRAHYDDQETIESLTMKKVRLKSRQN